MQADKYLEIQIKNKNRKFTSDNFPAMKILRVKPRVTEQTIVQEGASWHKNKWIYLDLKLLCYRFSKVIYIF